MIRQRLKAILGTVLACVAVWFPAPPVAAHDARPVSILIRELPNDRFALRVQVPDSVALDNQPRLRPPESCQPVAIGDGDATAAEAVISCPGGIGGAAFAIAYPIYNPSLSTLYRFEPLGRDPVSSLQPPSESSWTIPVEPSAFAVARDYFRLGVEHIIGGWDHLLFVAGLLVIAGTWRRSLVALTGFTLAHSVTLALSALDIVRLPAPPVEAVIALSIIFLAVEIVRDRKHSLTFRYPALVASLFGLLHGFGFAGVLREIGIPQSEIATALLAFNLGVEAGQVAFVAVLLGLAALAKRAASAFLAGGASMVAAKGKLLAAYLMGSVAFFWLFQRLGGFV